MGSKVRRGVGAVCVSAVWWTALTGGAPGVAAAWNVAGASVYNGCPGAGGDVCGGAGFAELGGSGGVLMGGLAPRTLVRIRFGSRSVDVRKLDWGTGGGDVFGLSRAIDLPCSTANRLGIGDCTNWTGVVRWKLLVHVKRMRGWVPQRKKPRHKGRGSKRNKPTARRREPQTTVR